MKAATRAELLRVHRWIGLALAPLLLLQGASGAAVAFRGPIDRWLDPVVPATRWLPLQLLSDRASEPGARIDRITLPEDPGGAAVVRLQSAAGGVRLVAIDPYRGTVLRRGGLSVWPTELIFRLHETLLAGAAGHVVVGLEGIALLALLLVGLLAWWPGGARWRTGFRLVRGSPDRLVRSAHRTAGGALALLLLVSAGTGIVLVFKPQVGWLIGATPKPAPVVTALPPRAPLSLDRLVAIVRADQGPLPLHDLRIAGAVVTVALDDPDSLRRNAVRQVQVDARDGRILGRHLPMRLPAANGVLDWPIRSTPAARSAGRARR